MKNTDNLVVQVDRDDQHSPSMPAAGCDLRSGLVQGTGDLLCDKSASVEPGTTSPAMPKPRTNREFERALRTLGYSQREAKTIANHGFRGLAVADPAEDVSELAALLERNTKLFERILKDTP